MNNVIHIKFSQPFMPRPRTKHPNYTMPVIMAAIAVVMVVISGICVRNCFAADTSTIIDPNVVIDPNHAMAAAVNEDGEWLTKGAPMTCKQIAGTELPAIYLDVPMDYVSNSGFKAYMDYRTITSPSSKQYALQQKATTDPETGIRMYDGCYMVALGTYYAQQAGERFHITLTSGVEFDAITGDIKADIHTDPLHQHRNGNIVEFIVDTLVISKTCKVMGDMSWTGFEGQISSIEKLQDEV